MDDRDELVRAAAQGRLASIFRVSATTLSTDLRFGYDLKASFVSNFRRNELDRINDDIRDVADREILKELSSGRLTISTVGDYCDHMVRCSKTKPIEVKRIVDVE